MNFIRAGFSAERHSNPPISIGQPNVCVLACQTMSLASLYSSIRTKQSHNHLNFRSVSRGLFNLIVQSSALLRFNGSIIKTLRNNPSFHWGIVRLLFVSWVSCLLQPCWFLNGNLWKLLTFSATIVSLSRCTLFWFMQNPHFEQHRLN